MRIWLPVLFLLALLALGCVDVLPSNAPATPTPAGSTPTPQVIYVTVTPTPTPEVVYVTVTPTSTPTPAPTATPTPLPTVATPTPKSFQEIADEAKQSTLFVQYEFVRETAILKNLKSYSFVGSAVIIGASSDGRTIYALTNRHVVDWRVVNWNTVDSGAAGYDITIVSEQISATTYGGSTYSAERVWVAPGDIDFAVITFTKAKDDFRIADVDYSQVLKTGDDVFAVGAPRALSFSVTKGIVSAVRSFQTTGNMPYTAIQTDTAINPGNSGGGLFTINGKLVGINSFILTASEGLNFAISVKTFKDYNPQLSQQFGTPVAEQTSDFSTILVLGHAVDHTSGQLTLLLANQAGEPVIITAVTAGTSAASTPNLLLQTGGQGSVASIATGLSAGVVGDSYNLAVSISYKLVSSGVTRTSSGVISGRRS